MNPTAVPPGHELAPLAGLSEAPAGPGDRPVADPAASATGLLYVQSCSDPLRPPTRYQLELLQPARARPYLLDDDTVARIIRVHHGQADGLGLFQNQADKWEAARA